MRAISLMYHDVVEGDDWDSSGYAGPGSAKYKLNRRDFAAHLAAVAKTRLSPPVIAQAAVSTSSIELPLLVTFDDGGVSALSPVADLLDERGWKAHFFITVNQIGKRGFMSAQQIRDLRKRGHAIGSHSLSHPTRMAYCDDETLAHEWAGSVAALSDLLGDGIDTASVPGGYYSRRVAEAAAAARIRILFNSEPTTEVRRIQDCLVFGRFTLVRGMRPEIAARLASGHLDAHCRQWISWNLKKLAKRAAGRRYLSARRRLLRES